MHLEIRMGGQKVLDSRSLVAADVVADDIDFTPYRLAGDHVTQEGNELRTGVPP